MADNSDPDKNQIDEKELATKQALKYAQDLAQTYGELRGSESRYRALFDYAPISLWEMDWSQIKNYIDGLRHEGVQDLKQYFGDHPEGILHCVDLIRFIDVNRTTLALYEAESKEDLFFHVKSTINKEAQDILKEELITLSEAKSFELECVHKTLKGRELTVLTKTIIPPGCEDSWSKVLFSVYDLTERVRADFLKKMFGRYISEEVMNTLIENPESVKLGGEKRRVTIMITDLRGFTALSERLDPEQVVRILNSYFEVMLGVVHQYQGTLNEIVGDSMLIIFGAPQELADRAHRAIACAIEMQNAMTEVNNNNRSQGLPEIEMGIGINDAEVIVGNIGSRKRSKYGLVGSGVNITSRIESYSVGGQILISESMYEKTGENLRVDDKMEIHAKGSETSLILYDVGGISGEYNLALDREAIRRLALVRPIPVRYSVLDGSKYFNKGEQKGSILCLSLKSAEIRLRTALEPLTNLKLNLSDVSDDLSQKDFFGKIIKDSAKSKRNHILRFTSVPPEISSYFQALCKYAAKVED